MRSSKLLRRKKVLESTDSPVIGGYGYIEDSDLARYLNWLSGRKIHFQFAASTSSPNSFEPHCYCLASAAILRSSGSTSPSSTGGDCRWPKPKYKRLYIS